MRTTKHEVLPEIGTCLVGGCGRRQTDEGRYCTSHAFCFQDFGWGKALRAHPGKRAQILARFEADPERFPTEFE